MQLVFATHNPNKLKEIQALLPDTITVLSLDDIGCTEAIPESAKTLEGNALIKANYVKQKYGYDCFADDTGLEVEALNNAPGVYSARYAGFDSNSDANMNRLLLELKDTTNRNARFRTVIALLMGNEKFFFTGICNGQITKEKRGKAGFGYDPIFQPDGYARTFAELTADEKNKISHRGKAMHSLLKYFS